MSKKPPPEPEKSVNPGSTVPSPFAALGRIVGFAAYAAMRFRQDGCQQRASALTFTTLLALVPLLAVGFAIFSAFPAFERLEDRVMDLIFSQIPRVGDQVRGYLEDFTAKTGSLTAVGIVFLAVTAVMLLVTISGTFNTIWRAEQTRGIISRMLVFWAVLTLTPMLLGASFSLSTYLFAAARATGVESVTGGLANLAFALTFMMQTAGLMVLYIFMPNYPVRIRDGLTGGLIAAILLDLLKRGFGFYITRFPAYETIYGAMAAVPIFLIWMYVSWMVVLFGAEVAAGLPEWRHGIRRATRDGPPPLEKLSAALSVLHALYRASRDGERLSERRLARVARLGPLALTWATKRLARTRYIARTDRGGWVLSRDLTQVSLSKLYTDLGLDLSGRLSRCHRGAAWGRRFASVMEDAARGLGEAMKTDLATLLAPSGRIEADIPAADIPGANIPDEDESPPNDALPKPPFTAR